LCDPADMTRGTVKFFKPEKGWGAIASPELPDGLDAWVHFSVIEMDGYRALDQGDQVEFEYEAAQQDSFRFRATRVRKI
jgi:cold shock protein